MNVDFQSIQLYAKQKGVDIQTAALEMGLTPEEVKELQSIGGDPGKNEDDVTFTSKKKLPNKNNETASKSKNGWGQLLTGAAIGAAAGLFLGGPGGALIGGLIGVCALGMASCTDIEQDVELQIVTSKNSNEEIIAALSEFSGNILKALAELKNEIKVGTDRIVVILEGLGFQLDEIYSVLLEQGTKADEILKEIQKNTENQDQKLDALSKDNKEIKNLLGRILDAMNQGNKIATNNNELLTEVLYVLAEDKANDASALSLLEKILAKVTEGVEQNKDMDTKTHELLTSILGKLDTFDADVKELVASVIDKLDELGENALPLLQSILENIQNFNADNKTLLTEVIAKIDTFDKDTQKTLQLIIGALGKLGEDGNKLLNEILNGVLTGNGINLKNQELLKLVLEKMEVIKNNNNAANDKINAFLEKIVSLIADFAAQNKEMDAKTQGILEKIVAQIDKVDANNQAFLEKIVSLIDNFATQDKEMDEVTYNALLMLMDSVNNLDANTQTGIGVIIEAICQLGENESNQLGAILEAINKGNLIGLQNQDVLKTISDKIDKLSPTDNKESIELLKQILAKVVELTAQQKAMDTDTQALIKDLINSFNKFDIKTQEALATIIEKMDKLGATGQAALEKVLNAIKDNTNVAKGTQELVKALLDKVGKLGDKADAIIEVVSNIGVGEKVDLTKIEDMLAKLLEQEKANQKIFTDINSKLNLVAVTLQGLAPQIDANNKAVLAKLQEILDKIPNGCKCTHESVDITVIVEKLDKIIEEIKKDPKNEGILGDLGNLDNLLG